MMGEHGMYNTILFDLDGTLTDPGMGITNSVAYALEKYNIKNVDRTELYKFIGPPLKDSFMQFYEFSEADAMQAIEYYREYFRDKGIFENVVYENIERMLYELKQAGKEVILATSKPEEFAVRILEHFELLKYFDYVAGATFDGTRSKKADVIRYALENRRRESLSDVVMVGDREHDIIGANENGIASIGVMYGYGCREEFEKYGATYIVETTEDLLEVLMS